MIDFLEIHRGDAPLVVSFPHGGTDIPDDLAGRFTSLWRARKDTDWAVHALYGFAQGLGATTIRTRISRSVIDCNRDPSGASLYPGQPTTGLCPTTTFDGEPLYRYAAPDEAEIARRRAAFFDPYHAALSGELDRLSSRHGRVVLYDAHSIRSRIRRLFDGILPQFNIGTNGGRSCAPSLAENIAAICRRSGLTFVCDGRFRGGWTTRRYGCPDRGIHAIQMELAQRGYMAEPDLPTEENWPGAIDPDPAIGAPLRDILHACIAFAKGQK